MNKIFIGHNDKMPMISDVFAYSIKKYASKPVDIHLLKLSELNFNRPWEKYQTTPFSFSRFLVPFLCEYNGLALFADDDFLCLPGCDINELFNFDMTNYALRVVKHNHVPTAVTKMDGQPQTVYPRKNWSSLMLMRCDLLKCWTKEAVETQSGSWLHQFKSISDELIGDLPSTWNKLDAIEPDTKMVHYTSGVPAFSACADRPFSLQWYKAYYDMMNNR
jgi:hypothetical protein